MNHDEADSAPRRWLVACGASLMLLAATVLAGRFAGWPAAVTWGANGVPMAFATATAFLVLGATLLAQAARRRALAGAGAVALCIFGFGVLSLYAVAESVGIRRFMFDPSVPFVSRVSGFGGRISPNTALAFLLAGLVFLLLRARTLRTGWIGMTLALLLAMAGISAVSYLTGLRAAEGWWRYTPMAVHTAVGFLVTGACLAVWLARRASTSSRAMTRTLPFFVVAGAAMLVQGMAILVSNEQRQDATRLENRALQVEAAIDRFIASVARLESSTRAYVLTGEALYLERMKVHEESIVTAEQMLVQLTIDNPVQHGRALALRPLVTRKLAINYAQAEARQASGIAAGTKVLREEDPEVMAGLRASTEGMQEDERRVLGRRRQETELNERRLTLVLVAGGLLTVGLIGAAFSLVQRAQRQLQEANEHLEVRVQQRTAQLEASAARLRESERRAQFLADTMPQLVWTARADGIVESLNRGWRDYLGASDERAALEGYANAVLAEDLPGTVREWELMLREQRPGGGEARLRRADGTYRWHLWRAHPERAADGGIVRWVGTWTDIHDQKTAEAELERRVAERTAELTASQERFQEAFEFAGIGMAIVSPEGRFARVNKSLCEILGYSESELRAKTFQDITHPDDLAADLALLEELVAGQRRFYQMEKRYLVPHGEVWARLTVSLVRNAAGGVENFISQIEDVSAQKRLEANLALARDQALEASRLKSEFLATMSHEIRTPMNGVIGMTTLLRHTPLTAAQEEYVNTIAMSGESLLAIIDDILDYSKIEAGRMELDVATFELRTCVQQTVDFFALRARAKGLELRCEIAERVPAWVSGDATRLRQVMMNLLSNAVKFTAAGGVTLTLDAAPEGNAVRLEFAVKDTGIGIASEGMERLFKSFSQVDASTTRRFGGTGLGLAISKRLAELMGGTVSAESAPGEGSTFRFTAVVRPRASEAAERSAAGAFDASLGERCPLRLLLAEDNPVNQRVAILMLKRLGYEDVAVVENGLKAVVAVQATTFDVVLMDVEMPELDGCAATQRIRALGGAARRPWIIALTAGAMQGDRERAFAAGMNDFVTKPVRGETLAEALARAHGAVTVDNGSRSVTV